MQTSLKTGFAQNFLVLPKKSELPKIWGAAAPLAPRPVRLCVWQITAVYRTT